MRAYYEPRWTPKKANRGEGEKRRALTRRQFAALVGGGMLALAGGTMIGCTPKSEASEKVSRTVSCDVLVVGGGGAGVSAAAMAAGAGANTILIEKEA